MLMSWWGHYNMTQPFTVSGSFLTCQQLSRPNQHIRSSSIYVVFFLWWLWCFGENRMLSPKLYPPYPTNIYQTQLAVQSLSTCRVLGLLIPLGVDRPFWTGLFDDGPGLNRKPGWLDCRCTGADAGSWKLKNQGFQWENLRKPSSGVGSGWFFEVCTSFHTSPNTTICRSNHSASKFI